MAFLGKEYKLVKQENYGDFLKSLDISEEKVQSFLATELTEKIVKNGDSYTFFYNTPLENKEFTFKSGEEFKELVEDGVAVKSTYKIDGNTIHQVSKGKDIVANFKREYNGNDLVATMTSNKWDGVARVYYKA